MNVSTETSSMPWFKWKWDFWPNERHCVKYDGAGMLYSPPGLSWHRLSIIKTNYPRSPQHTQGYMATYSNGVKRELVMVKIHKNTIYTNFSGWPHAMAGPAGLCWWTDDGSIIVTALCHYSDPWLFRFQIADLSNWWCNEWLGQLNCSSWPTNDEFVDCDYLGNGGLYWVRLGHWDTGSDL